MARSMASSCSREARDSVQTEDRMSVRLTSAMASQNHRKIFAKRLRKGGLSSFLFIRDDVEISRSADGFDAFLAIGKRTEFPAQIADVDINAAIESI